MRGFTRRFVSRFTPKRQDASPGGSAAGYNRLASVYGTFERLAFGNLLSETRRALLPRLKLPETVLIVGEGPGELLAELLMRFPAAQVTCVEQSAAMIRRAQAGLPETARLTWRQADVTGLELPRCSFDLIVTTFLLDSFEGPVLRRLMGSLAESLRMGGQWYYADFAVPRAGWQRRRAQTWLWLLYHFFGWQTGLKVRRLENHAALFAALDLSLDAEQTRSRSLLVTRIYRKAATPSAASDRN